MDSPSSWFAEVLPILLRSEEVPSPLIRNIISVLTAGEFDPMEAGAFLIALRMKGETGSEIAAAATALRERMVVLPHSQSEMLDTCGTGGDESGTFNISTAVSLVVAGAGCPVVKHGNRSVSSRSGSADVLRELGVPIESGPTWAGQCLERYGYAFCFAPHYHPAMGKVAGLRRKLGVRTIFNLLGPLLNPASAPYQLLGVGRAELLDPLAEAVAQSGVKQAFLVHGAEGLDEVSLSGPTFVRHVRAGIVECTQWQSEDFGLLPCHLKELKVADPAESAAVIQQVLQGKEGPHRRIVLANAAAALYAANQVSRLTEGVVRAAHAIDTGRALHILEQLRMSH